MLELISPPRQIWLPSSLQTNVNAKTMKPMLYIWMWPLLQDELTYSFCNSKYCWIYNLYHSKQCGLQAKVFLKTYNVLCSVNRKCGFRIMKINKNILVFLLFIWNFFEISSLAMSLTKVKKKKYSANTVLVKILQHLYFIIILERKCCLENTNKAGK